MKGSVLKNSTKFLSLVPPMRSVQACSDVFPAYKTNLTFASITGRSDGRLISAPGAIRVWVRDHNEKTKILSSGYISAVP